MITLQPIPSSKDQNFLENLLNLSPLKPAVTPFGATMVRWSAIFEEKLKLAHNYTHNDSCIEILRQDTWPSMTKIVHDTVSFFDSLQEEYF